MTSRQNIISRIIHGLPVTLAFISLSPLFALFFFAFTQIEPPVAVHTEAFALFIFQGCIPTAAAFFALSFFSLVTQEI